MTRRGRCLAASAVALLLLAVLAVLGAPGTPARAASPIFYTDRATFEAALGTTITDDYAAPIYPGDGTYDDATFSAYKGETDYHTTGFTNTNLLNSATYCAGCNGSFLLSFQTTSVTRSETGVYGVGVDILTNSQPGYQPPYNAFITYGDGTTDDVPLPAGASFFGVTAPELIESIHFGLEKGGATQDGYFEIDNLTIGGEYIFYLPLSLYRVAG